MEEYVKLSNQYIETKKKIKVLESELLKLKEAWETSALSEIGLNKGDMVEYRDNKYIVERRDDSPDMGACKWVKGYRIKKDGTTSTQLRFIGQVTGAHKVK